MIRGGTWQKQKGSSVCLLCRHRRTHLRPTHAFRTYASSSSESPAKPITSWAAWGADPKNWGVSPAFAAAAAATAASQPDDGLLPHERAAREKLMKRAPAKSVPVVAPEKAPEQAPQTTTTAPAPRPLRPSPSMTTSNIPPQSLTPQKKELAATMANLLLGSKNADTSDGLLPHERAAREKLMKRAPARPVPATDPAPRPPGPPQPQQPQNNDLAAMAGLLLGSKNARPDDGLLPHERAAREKLMKRAPVRPVPATTPEKAPETGDSKYAHTGDGLLPHERAVRDKLLRTNVKPAQLPDPHFVPPPKSAVDRARQEFASMSQLGGTPGSRRDQAERSSGSRSDSANPWESRDSMPSQGFRITRIPSTAPARPGRPEGGQSQPGNGQRDGPWGQLARRNRPQQDFGAAGPLGDKGSLPDLGSSGSNTARSDFWDLARDRFPPKENRPPQAQDRRFEGRETRNNGADPWESIAQAAGLSTSTVGAQDTINRNRPEERVKKTNANPWADIEPTVTGQASKTKPTSIVPDWSWADEHEDEIRLSRVKQQLSSEAIVIPPREDKPLDRSSSRRDRDRGDRLEKPKKGRPRRGQRDDEGEEDFDADAFQDRRRKKAERKAEREREQRLALEQAGPTPIFLPEFISVANLGVALGVKTDLFLRQLEELGFEDVSKESILAGETAALVAQEYGFEPTVDTGEREDLKPRPAGDTSDLPLRPPVVTIMGHVDHGKTTLLDYLRKSSIVAGEHGGITQHIGAFSVKLSNGKQITFLDTPGHAAFLSMRQRGASVTDIVILVVAADDSVKPQTLEALKHARAAKVPIIVAISKADKDDANVDRVKSDLATQGVEIEDYGGDVQVVPVSGKTGLGMADLEENILLLAEMLDIRAETDGMAEGWVLESSIKPIGRVATILVKRGTLRQGDFIVAGRVWTKVRSLRDESGAEITEAPPGTAVEVLGWKEPPDAGDQVLQAPTEGKAKDAAHYRIELKEREDAIAQMALQEQERREKEAKKAAEAAEKKLSDRKRSDAPDTTAAADTDAAADDEPAGTKIVNFVVKGDVHGSVEAVCASIMEIGTNEVRPRILLSATGQITESDVEHAATSGSHIVNFNNPVPGHMKRMADDAGVRIIDHKVIYHLAEEVRDALSDLLPPTVTTKVVGEAEVLQVFPINVNGRVFVNVAGCRVRNGAVTRNAKCRVLRGGIWFLKSLKHGKKSVPEMKKGGECGIAFPGWDQFLQGDHIQVIEEKQEKRRL
ncbi:hypothetical protein B0T19DRAFT_493110 [Cercophora scortea]|uniref:Translation initiation factor IF-2, mitochondrial n=1 Tax=Cercophora scortea TaxID=314031 RepID=A0AAE0I7A1_9PEZI|nr:hypothetical protein B0T19DRAFT_493110 [Cercophora scortea]